MARSGGCADSRSVSIRGNEETGRLVLAPGRLVPLGENPLRSRVRSTRRPARDFLEGLRNDGFRDFALPAADWSSWRSFRFDVENDYDEPFFVYVRLSNRRGSSRGRNLHRRHVRRFRNRPRPQHGRDQPGKDAVARRTPGRPRADRVCGDLLPAARSCATAWSSSSPGIGPSAFRIHD